MRQEQKEDQAGETEAKLKPFGFKLNPIPTQNEEKDDTVSQTNASSIFSSLPMNKQIENNVSEENKTKVIKV